MRLPTISLRTWLLAGSLAVLCVAFVVVDPGILVKGMPDFDFFGSDDARAPAITATSDVRKLTDDPIELRLAISEHGVRKLMTELLAQSGGGSAFDCHQFAHRIGRNAYLTRGSNAFRECDGSCHSGCYHGAMEEFLNKEGTADLSAKVQEICTAYDTQYDVFECLHGVGHGVLAYLDYDMPGALEQCDQLVNEYSQSSCMGGVFMENVLTGQGLGADKAEHETKWVSKDPHFPCNAIDQREIVQLQCYRMQTSWMLWLNGYDFDDAARECQDAAPAHVRTCFRSYGRDAAGHTLRDPDKILQLCDKLPRQSDWYDQCLIGALNVIIEFWGGGLGDQAAELCHRAEEPHRQACLSYLASRLKELFTDPVVRIERCKALGGEQSERCIRTVTEPGPPGLPTDAVVRMIDGGFDPPQTVIVQTGKVTFVNEDDVDRWPASNIHPTHGVYPAFDPLAPIPPGQSWTFTFSREGIWHFHDHLLPQLGGTIVTR